MTDYFSGKCPLFETGLTPSYYLKINSAGTQIESEILPADEAVDNAITALQSDMTTAEGNITTLQADVAELTTVGSVRMTLRSTAATGWLLLNGQTIGDGSSGGTSRANADTETLFSALWGDYSNSVLVIQDSGGNPTTRGATAAADFAAHKRLPLPNMCSRFPIGVGTGSGLTQRTLGASSGAETVTLTANELPTHTHSVTDSGHTHVAAAGSFVITEAGTPNAGIGTGSSLNWSASTASSTTGITLANTGSGNAQNVMNPFWALNFEVKY